MTDGQLTHRYTLDSNELPSDGVYFAVAALKNCSPLDVPPLAEAIDPDALDALVRDTTKPAEVSFRYSECGVTATPGEIRVE